jgi:hypothetical protein
MIATLTTQKKLTKTHEYVLCGSAQDQMEMETSVSKTKGLERST